jgi:hypothetical protein
MNVIHIVLVAMLIGGPPGNKHWHDEDDHGKKHEKHHQDNDELADGCYFRHRDIVVITDYYAPRYKPLPPGLQKKLYRTGHLPPGWERKLEPFPVVIERQLVPLPPEYRRGIIDGYAVVYSPKTQVIVDLSLLFGAH